MKSGPVRRLAAALVVLTTLGAAASAHAQRVDLTLLHVNDIYEISPRHGAGGFAPLMTLLERERARAAHHLTTFGGDLISPSILSGLTRGRQMIELMNAIDLNVAGLGNHEFDFGAEVLKRRMAESKFPWLATNTLGADGKPFGGAAATLTREVGGLKLGIFSLLTPLTGSLAKPGDGVLFAPVLESARSAVAALKAKGADLIIALTHLDIAEDRRLARDVPEIRVILGGHDHDPMAFYEGGTLILKAGQDARFLAVAELRLEKTGLGPTARVSMLPQWRFLSTAGVPPDARIAKMVAGYAAKLGADLARPLGRTTVTLDGRRTVVRARESALGNLIADAMRAATGAEIALTNGGGIRGDRLFEAGSILSRGDVLALLPFGNVTVTLALSGADLRAALEHAVAGAGHGGGHFAHISGMRFRYDAARPPGRRVIAASVGGNPLDANRTYVLATNDYLARGGDGYAMLRRGRPVIDASAGRLMASQVMDHISRLGTIAPRLEGRIRAE